MVHVCMGDDDEVNRILFIDTDIFKVGDNAIPASTTVTAIDKYPVPVASAVVVYFIIRRLDKNAVAMSDVDYVYHEVGCLGLPGTVYSREKEQDHHHIQ